MIDKRFNTHVWDSEAEVSDFLFSLVKLHSSKTFLEVGTFQGFSTFPLLKELGENFTAVDIEDNRPDFVKEEYEKNKAWFILNDSVTVLQAFVKEGRKYDCIFIDTYHSYEQVTKEWIYAKNVVSKGGLVVFHDSISFADEVGRFINELKSYDNLEVITFNTPLYEGKKMSGLSVVKVS